MYWVFSLPVVVTSLLLFAAWLWRCLLLMQPKCCLLRWFSCVNVARVARTLQTRCPFGIIIQSTHLQIATGSCGKLRWGYLHAMSEARTQTKRRRVMKVLPAPAAAAAWHMHTHMHKHCHQYAELASGLLVDDEYALGELQDDVDTVWQYVAGA